MHKMFLSVMHTIASTFMALVTYYYYVLAIIGGASAASAATFRS